jgi:Stigma-specific protein, Stig1
MRFSYGVLIAATTSVVLSMGCGGRSDSLDGQSSVPCTGSEVQCGGACVELQRDPVHCGACDATCAPSDVCIAGSCQSVCAQEQTPCGPEPADCADLGSDHDNCGACGNDCGPLVCDRGVCADICSAGLENCAGSCVDLGTSVAHCGACGSGCALPNAIPSCVGGACDVDECWTGSADCDGIASNGCEADVEADPSNCGACGEVCQSGEHASPACGSAKCSVMCDAGFADCDGVADNGCETSLFNDSANCGACGNDCGGYVCVAGACGSECLGGLTSCEGTCTDIQSDPANCGGCGSVCDLSGAEATCVGGSCKIASCDAGFDDCDGSVANGCETPVSNDEENCGSCGNSCAYGIECTGGACSSPGILCGPVTCPDPQLCCSSGGGMGGSYACFDPNVQTCSGELVECDDPSDCGAGEVCCSDVVFGTSGATCSTGCSGTILCAQSLDCSPSAPYCCPSGGMVESNVCGITPC